MHWLVTKLKIQSKRFEGIQLKEEKNNYDKHVDFNGTLKVKQWKTL